MSLLVCITLEEPYKRQARLKTHSSSIAMEIETITKMPNKEKTSLVVILCFMSRSALERLLMIASLDYGSQCFHIHVFYLEIIQFKKVNSM